jgi:hypothetical protein
MMREYVLGGQKLIKTISDKNIQVLYRNAKQQHGNVPSVIHLSVWKVCHQNKPKPQLHAGNLILISYWALVITVIFGNFVHINLFKT